MAVADGGRAAAGGDRLVKRSSLLSCWSVPRAHFLHFWAQNAMVGAVEAPSHQLLSAFSVRWHRHRSSRLGQTVRCAQCRGERAHLHPVYYRSRPLIWQPGSPRL